jgi:hypothetical protein
MVTAATTPFIYVLFYCEGSVVSWNNPDDKPNTKVPLAPRCIPTPRAPRPEMPAANIDMGSQ